MAIFLTILQLLAAASAGVLHYFSHTSVGVNHHVVFKKYAAFRTFLRPELLRVYGIAAIAAAAVIAVLLALGLRKKLPGRRLRALAVLECLTALLALELTVPAARDIPIYLYLLGLTLLAWALQLCKALLAKKRKK